MTSTRVSQRLLLAAAAVLTFSLAACASAGQAATTSSDAGTPVSGGTLTFYDPVEYKAWNPTNSLWSNSNVAASVADRLIWQVPETGEFKPWLATSWDVSDDHLTYTFHLRDDVTFSDGTPLDGEIVKYNFDTYGLGDEAKGIAKSPWWGDYVGTEVVDPHTVTVTLAEPDAAFLQTVSNYRAASILGKSYLDLDFAGQGDLTQWVATGPFVVESVNGTTGVTLARRDDYDWPPEGSDHTGPAYLDKIVFKVVPEAGTRVGALQSGEAQIARNIAPYDEETVKAGGGVIHAAVAQGETNDLTVSLDATGSPIAEFDVRLALQAATDREEIHSTVLSDSFPVPTSALTQGTPLRGDSSKYLVYDLQKAKDLLDGAGWVEGTDGIRVKDGKRLSFEIWIAPHYQPVGQLVLELLQDQWKKAGVELNINQATPVEYANQQAKLGDNWPFTQGQQSTAEPSVLLSSYGFDRSNGLYAPAPIPELESLLEAQKVEFDPTKRAAIIQQIEDYLFSNALSIPLYDETQVFGLSPKVHGYKNESTARSWFYDTWLEQ